MKFKAVSALFYRGFARAHSLHGLCSIPSQIQLQLTILGDRIKKGENGGVGFNSRLTQSGWGGLNPGYRLGKAPGKELGCWAGSVLCAVQGEGWLSRSGGKRKWAEQAGFGKNGPRPVFIPKNLFHFANFFEFENSFKFKPNLNFK
jgi:hypothetical protein